MPLTLDSSVFIAALRETEEKHTACRRVVESIVHGNHVAIEPYSVLVEVVAAIRRRTGNRTVAQRIGFDLQNIATILFLEFLKPRALSAMDIANDIGLKGMDAITFKLHMKITLPCLPLIRTWHRKRVPS